MSASASNRTVEYEYTKLVGAQGMHADPRFNAMLGFNREIWVGTDGSGLSRESRGPISFFTEQGRLRWEAAGSPVLARDRGVELYAPGCTSGPRSMRSLLVNHRGGLAAALAEIVGLNLRHIRDPLGQGAVDPGFCRAVFAVAQQIRGVETMDAVVDQTGRSGTGLAQTLGRHRFELIFSTDLGELLGYQSFFAQPMAYAPAGALHSWCAYLERRIDLSLPADVPPVPRRRGERARAGRGLLIRPGFSIVTGSAQDPLKQLAELHDEGVLTDADYESAKVMQAWAGFDDGRTP